jgi:dipeptidyl aminopeptidase/acylaminoacyl peptidase
MAELVGDPETEQHFLRERSPITYANNIKADLLIIQGANDPRVVKEESDQIVETVRHRGSYVEYMVFEDEGHGFTKYSNLIMALRRSSKFLTKRLSLRKQS